VYDFHRIGTKQAACPYICVNQVGIVAQTPEFNGKTIILATSNNA